MEFQPVKLDFPLFSMSQWRMPCFFAIQYGGFCTMWPVSAKGPLEIDGVRSQVTQSTIMDKTIKKILVHLQIPPL